MTLMILCLTKHLHVNAQNLLLIADTLKISSSPNEHNLACLLYLKLCLTPSMLSSNTQGRLSESIISMALELGVFSSAINSEYSCLRNHLWLGTVILLEPHFIDVVYLESFDLMETSCSIHLTLRYQFKTKIIAISRRLMESASHHEINNLIASLDDYFTTIIQAQGSDPLIYQCRISLQSLKLNVFMMMLLQCEQGYLMHDHERINESFLLYSGLSNSLLEYFTCCDAGYHTLNDDIFFGVKTLASYALGMSLRLKGSSYLTNSDVESISPEDLNANGQEAFDLVLSQIRDQLQNVDEKLEVTTYWLSTTLNFLAETCDSQSLSFTEGCRSVSLSSVPAETLLFLAEDEDYQSCSTAQDHINFLDSYIFGPDDKF